MCFSFAGRSTWLVALTIAISNSQWGCKFSQQNRTGGGKKKRKKEETQYFIGCLQQQVNKSSHLVITVYFRKGNCGGILYSADVLPQACLSSPLPPFSSPQYKILAEGPKCKHNFRKQSITNIRASLFLNSKGKNKTGIHGLNLHWHKLVDFLLYHQQQ